ncbi:MAG TPA: glycosyltransferase [Candidatus Methylomirabilis sp.]
MVRPPSIFRCPACGRQYLAQRDCCAGACEAAPPLPDSIADSARPQGHVSISIILPAGGDAAAIRGAVAGFLKDPPRGAFEFVLVASRAHEGVHEFARNLARGHTVRLLLARPDGRPSLGRLWNLGARAARGSLLVFAHRAAGAGAPGSLEAFEAALRDPRLGLVGLETLWRDRRPEPCPTPFDPRYVFTRIPLRASLFGVRAEVFWEMGGMREAGAPGAELLDFQYRLIRAHYRLARAKVPAGRDGHAAPARRDRRRPGGLGAWRRRFARHRYPRLSVAIATRNYGRWLPRCLDSVLRSPNPTGAPVQIVVADDCSTDETPLVLEEYRVRYPRNLTVLSLRTSRGVGAAKNAAIRRAVGEYVALLDADDEFTAEKIARCHAELRAHPDTSLLTHDYTFIDDDSGRRSVTEGRWAGGWRPPGVWVFRNGLVRFNEQMVCGYEELEWTERCWGAVRRRHLPAPLALVHGTRVGDRWKADREVAGAQALTRWDRGTRGSRAAAAFACRACGSQYLRRAACCGRATEAARLVCFMTAASAPGSGPVAISVIVFVGDDLSGTRRAVGALSKDPEARGVEWIFVHCHPRRDLLAYLRGLSRAARVKAIFSPHGHPLVYSHDANRAARAAEGDALLCLAPSAPPAPLPGPLASIRAGLRDPRLGMLGAPPRAGLWAMRREVFWELGGMEERLLGRGRALLDLRRRAIAARYLTATRWRPAAPAPGAARRPPVSVALAARNAATRLASSLESLLALRGPAGERIQIVVVDDRSTDGTRLVLERYRRRFPGSFTVLHTDRVLGPAAAWNLAGARCIGRYIAWLRPGDRLTREGLAPYLRALEEGRADLVTGGEAPGSGSGARAGARARGRSASGRPRGAPGAGLWVFRSGVVRLNEQAVLGDPRREWLARCAPRLRWMRLPGGETARGRPPAGRG